MRQSKFNTWLTSLFLMLAFVGQTGFAQDVTWDFYSDSNAYGNPGTKSGVTVRAKYWTGDLANLFSGDLTVSEETYGWLHVTSEKAIAKVVFHENPGWQGMQTLICNKGSFTSLSTAQSTWEGNATDIVFNSNYDVYVKSIDIYFAGTGGGEEGGGEEGGGEEGGGEEGGGDTPTPGEFPKAGVGYYLQEAVNGLYLNVFENKSNPAKDVVLLSTPQALYFTEVVSGQFYITDESGNNFIGGYTNTWNMNHETPEVWTVEAVGSNYALKCVTTGGYLGFDNTTFGGEGSAAFRDKGLDKRGIFIITEATASTPVDEPITYTVIVSNAPDGAAVTLDGQSITGVGTYETTKALSLSDLSVTEPTGYYAESTYDATTHTFTVDFKAYLNYTVSVSGTDADAAGIVYNGITYHNGESILSKTALTLADVTAAPVDGLAGTVTLEGTVFTVTYAKAEYIEFVTSGLTGYTYSKTLDGVTVSGIISSDGGTLNLYDTVWGYDIKLSSPNRKIIKVEMQSADNMTAVNVNTGTFNATTKTWEGSTNDLTFSTTSGDYYISNIRVYLEPLAAKTYTVAITGNPSEAKLIYDGHEYADGDTFEATGITPEVLSATAIEGYMYSISVDGDLITVTYAEQFPKTGVAYYLQEANNSLYLNVFVNTNNRAKDVVLETTPQRLYFTATDGGFHIQDAEGLYIGGYEANTWNMNCETPEVWTVEPVTGGYALHCEQGYLGFNDIYTGGETSAAFRNKNALERAVFNILLAPAEEKITYTVVVTDAPEGTVVTLDGQDLTAGGAYETTKTLTLADLTVTAPNGYQVNSTYDETTHTFRVSFVYMYSYIVLMVDVPEGAVVTLDGQEFTSAGGGYESPKVLTLDNLTVTVPDGYYTEVSYDEATHIFTVVFKAYLQYTVTVTGTDDATAGIIYDGTTYHNGETILTKQALEATEVTAAEVSGYTAEITLDGTNITVAYTAEVVDGIDSQLSTLNSQLSTAYDLQGRRIAPVKGQHLPKGLNIVGGKKVIK